jgi:hypothetical protein
VFRDARMPRKSNRRAAALAEMFPRYSIKSRVMGDSSGVWRRRPSLPLDAAPPNPRN